ncbi:MAG TPA: insulinase family protein [Haloplasmataceae bacterium]
MNTNGFLLKKKTYIKDINSFLYEYHHEKTQAKLFYIENDDENKNFSIGFKTIPSDNTGVFHILEHSIMSGSKNYPLKTPMIYMMKNSLQTYLNASTYPDKTIYQVSSCNEKDFENLMDVYLDGVFHPLLSKETFLREGWHYELLDENSQITYNGVVYNEMKGSETSIYKRIYMSAMNRMFKDTCYMYNSGGDPKAIIDLTYEDYLKTYQKYYAANNCVICLYGKMDLDKKLRKIDMVLSCAPVNDEVIDINKQEPFIGDFIDYYPLSVNESLIDNTYMSQTYLIGDYSELELSLASLVLVDVLLGSNNAPLKKALLEIARDVNIFFIDGKQKALTISLIKTNLENKESFLTIVDNVLKDIVEKGFNHEELESALNNLEFSLKETNLYGQSKGIYYANNIITSVFYGCEVEKMFLYNQAFENLRKKIKTRFFEQLINDCLLNNKHKVLTILLPSYTMENDDKKREEDRLYLYQNTLSNEEKAKLVLDTKTFKQNQSLPDKKEDIAKMPRLQLSEISIKEEEIDTKIIDDIIFHENKLDDIVYVNYYFALNNVNIDDLYYVSLLGSILPRISTKTLTAKKLETIIKRYTGSFYFDIDVISQNEDSCIPFLVLRVALLKDNLLHLEEIVNEILNHSSLHLEEIRVILKQDLHYHKMNIMQQGNNIASKIAAKGLVSEAFYADKLVGLDYFLNLIKIVDSFNEDNIEKLKIVYKNLFTKNNLTISLISSKETLKAFNKPNINMGSINNNKYCFEKANNKRIAINIPSQVNYINLVASLSKLGFDFNGKMLVLAKYLSLTYLWDEIRAKGGAYGAQMSILSNGSVMMSSYRDPNMLRTLDIMENTYMYLENRQLTTEDLNGLIISTIADFDRPRTIKQKGITEDHNFFLNIDKDFWSKIREDIKSTTINDLLAFQELLRSFGNNRNYAVVGQVETLDKNLFDDIIYL